MYHQFLLITALALGGLWLTQDDSTMPDSRQARDASAPARIGLQEEKAPDTQGLKELDPDLPAEVRFTQADARRIEQWMAAQARPGAQVQEKGDSDQEEDPGDSEGKGLSASEAIKLLLSTQDDRDVTEDQAPDDQPDAERKPEFNIAQMTLSGVVHDSPPNVSLFGSDSTQMSLRDWLQRLAKARNDENIHAVALEIDFPQMSWAQASELADAVKRLDQVKPVHAHLVSARASDYLVASAARDVSLEPAGELMLVGLGAELTFLGETMEWIGIQPQMIQIGDYKGAAEPVTRSEPSEQLKGEYNKLLDGLYQQMVGQIARQRDLEAAAVRKAIDQGPLLGQEALKHKLVDQLVTRLTWREKVEKHLDTQDALPSWKEGFGKKEPQGLDLSNPFELLAMLTRGPSEPRTKDPTIAIIHADGMIVMGTSGESMFGGKHVGHKTLTEAFEQVRKDENIKAVIFRIDSPGGSALASELIYQAVEACSQKKPVIASVGSMAASGGYYVAMGADYILADPGAVVGSIGVVTGKLATKELLGKLKMHTWEITRGANAGLGFSRPWTAQELAKVKKHAQSVYDLFIKRVKQGRGEKIAKLTSVAGGRIFTAAQGRKLGMIDAMGGLREAVMVAQEWAGVERSHFIELPRPKTLADILSGSMGTRAPRPVGPESILLQRILQSNPGAAYWLDMMQLVETQRYLTALPYHLEIRR